MGDWNEALPTVKAKKRGIVEQRGAIKSKTKKPKHFHVDYHRPNSNRDRWRTYSRCTTKQEAESVLRKMMANLPNWMWRIRDNRVEAPHGKVSATI